MLTWKTIPSYPNYEVSNCGQVRRIAGGRGVKVGRILRQTSMPAGYLVASLWHGNKVSTKLVHRLVAEAYLGDPPDGHEVNHRDSNKANNAVGNLEYVTRSQNLRHATEATGAYRGEQNSQAIINDEIVRAIRRKHAEGMGYKRLSKHFGLSWSLVREVATRRNWSHVID